MSIKKKKPSALSFSALIAMALLWLSPFTWLVFTAFDPAATGAFALPDSLSLINFARIFEVDSLKWIVNSLIIGAGTATVVLVVTMLAAYPFSRLNFPGKDSILWGLVLIRIIPASAFILPLYLLSVKLGLLNHTGVILAGSLLNLPFGLLLMKNFYDSIPRTYEEAACIDGAGMWGTLIRIIFPACRSGAAVVWFQTFMTGWGTFMLPLIFLRKPTQWPMAVGLYSSFGLYGDVNYGFLSAFSILYALPPIIIYLRLRNNLSSGLAGAGIKG
ncbi:MULTISPECIES: ABC transporter permease subunit [unclassified Oceanispirochaeta]|uniref:ABC transporter permease subunit n=1 Tax=unclassified Oceanispirochaeta TaxID=2635722 RepID=UPI000E08E2E2|nr:MULTISPECIES: ABC transporter permease subunit [unclassified Oceanispirochaeta]MBF9017073.1 ABC transporter permease subunit [Oceanispirochaeta sp. M2]NPD73522.1 ABC transporter permease subunit [Oceanispirochaeta sp. M1]RDG30811.1 ABC transporter permease subunit [Oceanispirochaeta sp. M1]